MNQRLLSLLNQIEFALRQKDIEATHPLRALRSVDYRQGTARLVLEQADGSTWGTADVQGYRLANGETCVKITLGKASPGAGWSFSIFPREDCDWSAEAFKIAQAWLELISTEVAMPEPAQAVG